MRPIGLAVSGIEFLILAGLCAGCASAPKTASVAPAAPPVAAPAAVAQAAAPEVVNDPGIAVFNGDYSKISGVARQCPASLSVRSQVGQANVVEQVVMDEGADYVLDLKSRHRRDLASSDREEHFIDDRLTDNFEELKAKGEPIRDGAPRWKIKRIFSKKRDARAPITFSRFEVWEFIPKADGTRLIRLLGTPAPEFQCEYQAKAAEKTMPAVASAPGPVNP